MTQPDSDGSLEALVAADKGGCSGPPVGAQAPVAAKPLAELEQDFNRLCNEVALEMRCHYAVRGARFSVLIHQRIWRLVELGQEIESRTAASGFGGNRVLNEPGSDK